MASEFGGVEVFDELKMVVFSGNSVATGFDDLAICDGHWVRGSLETCLGCGR